MSEVHLRRGSRTLDSFQSPALGASERELLIIRIRHIAIPVTFFPIIVSTMLFVIEDFQLLDNIGLVLAGVKVFIRMICRDVARGGVPDTHVEDLLCLGQGIDEGCKWWVLLGCCAGSFGMGLWLLTGFMK